MEGLKKEGKASDPGMCGAAFFSAGRGKGKNPRGGAGWGGAKVKIHGAGRGGAGRGGAKKRVNRLIPKILQNCVNEKYDITYYTNNYKMLS